MAAPARIVALLVAFPLVLSACGQATKDSAEDFKGEQNAVAQTVEDLQSAASKGDEGKICDEILSADLASKIKAADTSKTPSCANRLKDSLTDADTFELQVEKVALDGTTATATVTSDAGGDKDRTDTLQLVKDDGSWKISSLGRAAS